METYLAPSKLDIHNVKHLHHSINMKQSFIQQHFLSLKKSFLKSDQHQVCTLGTSLSNETPYFKICQEVRFFDAHTFMST